MAMKSAKGKMWINITGIVFQILANIIFYLLVVICAVWLTQKAYHFSYEIFGDVSVDRAPGTDIVVTIREGESAKHLADMLEKKKLISNKTSFYIRVRLMVNQDDPILPGIYELNTSMDYKEIIETITDPGADLSS